MDRGVVSPGLSGATTTAWEPWFSGNPARWGGPGPLSASRLGGGVAEGREHMILRVIRRGHASLPVCKEVVSPGGAASPNRCLASPSGGVNGMCVWHVGEHELCSSDVGGNCGVVDHRVHGHFNWVRVFARITASVVLVSHSGASRAHRTTSSPRQVVAVRRDLDILQADPRVGLR